MRDLTFICAYYINPGMLREQLTVWGAYPSKLKAHFHTIITDDGSPNGQAAPVFQSVGLASQRLYRTDVDVRWNWLFCRNLGVQEATTEWVLLTDIDHVLFESTLKTILTSPLDASAVYRFSRVDAHGLYPWTELTPYKAHPNTWLMTRKMFDRVGGYDERFSGYYGSDSEFRERVHGTASAVIMLPDALVRYPREIIPDASTTTYQRKAKEDGIEVPRIKAERAALPNWRPLRVQLPYRLEASC